MYPIVKRLLIASNKEAGSIAKAKRPITYKEPRKLRGFLLRTTGRHPALFERPVSRFLQENAFPKVLI
jgi:hypothetical protein